MSENKPLARVCGAKTRAGTPCKRAPMPNGRCNLHGGKSPGGMASPHFKHGRYSKYMPAQLARRYAEALGASDLVDLKNVIAARDAFIIERLEAMAGASPEQYMVLRDQIEGALTEQRRDIEALEKVNLMGERAVSVTELGSFMGALVRILVTTITDQTEKNKVLNEINRIFTDANPGLARGGEPVLH